MVRHSLTILSNEFGYYLVAYRVAGTKLVNHSLVDYQENSNNNRVYIKEVYK